MTKSRPGDATEILETAYDPAGFVRSRSLAGAVTRFNGEGTAYRSDPYGLVTRAGTMLGQESIGEVSYGYDSLTSLSVAGGASLSYELDGLGRLSAIPGWLDTVTYDGAGRPLSAGYANGGSTSYGYDSRGNLRELAHAGTPGLPSYAFTFGRVGNITGKNQSSYVYDAVGRLTQAREDILTREPAPGHGP